MAWLARSIANSLRLEDDDNDEEHHQNHPGSGHDANQADLQPPSQSSPSPTANTPRGVKEDLSELTKTLRTQLWGVASFLAPPPPPEQNQPSDHRNREAAAVDEEEEDVIAGIRSDFAEIGGRFRTGISKLSSNIAGVSEFTKIASNLLQLGPEEEEEGGSKVEIGDVIGVTEEVVAFARDIAMHPETWLDFPLPDDHDDDDFDDFDLTDAQQEHALAVERLAPRLAALRMELCPGYMSEACFWKIYFVLLHPKLSKEDALLLSTPQVLEARANLSHELQRRTKATEQQDSSGPTPSVAPAQMEPLSVPPHAPSEAVVFKTVSVEATPSTNSSDIETEKHPIQSNEIKVIDKSVVDEKPPSRDKTPNSPTESSRVLDVKFEDDVDDWLKEDTSESMGVVGTSAPLGNDEDVSFSDLEEDDGDVPITYKKVASGSDSSAKDSPDWVQLGTSGSVKDIKPVGGKHATSGQVSTGCPETKESNDWLDVDDIDVI